YFFAIPRNHQTHHSFPTRRSSDLSQQPATEINCPGKVSGYDHIVVHVHSYPPADIATDSTKTLGPNTAAVGGRVFGHENVLQRRDRKSTRLNSSHLGISYAVFCLK